MPSPNLRRNCDRCGEIYLPNSRFNYICEDCIVKSKEKVLKDNKKRRKSNQSPSF